MRIRRLTTVAEVIDTIGGLRLQEITDRRSNNVTNWRNAGRFPPNTFVVMQAELKRLHCRAPDSLWGMIAAARAA